MHEMTITLNAVEICQELAKGRRVTAVTLEIGDLSDVVPEAVEFCFGACTRDTLLEGATLRIERVGGRGRCDCGNGFPVSTFCEPCPSCGGYGFEIVSGLELRVKELEVA